jgi:hypothetical protein
MSQVLTQLPKNTKLSGFAHLSSGTFSTIKSNLNASTDPLVTSDAAAGYLVGSLWINTTLDKIFQCTDSTNGAAIWNNLGTSTPTKLVDSISLTSHGFSAGDVIRKTGSSYTKAQADSEANAVTLGVAETITDANNFTVVYSGKLTKVGHGFGVGSILYLDQSVAGGLTSTAPTSGVKKPVAIVSDANSFVVLNSALVSSIADNTVKEQITQSTHGFVAGDVLRHNGTIYVKAQGTTGNSEAVGVVESSVDTNNFILVICGRITLSGRTAGAEYFLSAASAGLTTTTAPTASGNVQRPIYVATSATSAIVNISKIGVIK